MLNKHALCATICFGLVLTLARFLVLNASHWLVGFTISFAAMFFYHAIPKKEA